MNEINDYLSKADKNIAKTLMYRVYGMPGPLFVDYEEGGDTPTPGPKFTVSVSVNDETMGSVTGIPEGPVDAGTEVVLTAVPAEGYQFVSWSTGEETAELTIVVEEDVELTATFEAAVQPIPDNEIWYTSDTGETAGSWPSSAGTRFGPSMISNTYENGKGVLLFEGNVTKIGDYLFVSDEHVETIEIPHTVTSFGNDTFKQAAVLKSMIIRADSYTLNAYALRSMSKVEYLDLGAGCSSIGTQVLEGLGQTAPNRCKLICRRLTPPTLASNALQNSNNFDIYVPAEAVDTYKADTNWSRFADRIYAIS